MKDVHVEHGGCKTKNYRIKVIVRISNRKSISLQREGILIRLLIIVYYAIHGTLKVVIKQCSEIV